jgi:hypothetical protein
MNPLNLNKAFQLHDIIGKYLPENEEDIDALAFIGTIVKNIKDSENHRDYVDAVMLMSGKTWEEIKEMQYDEVLELFISGLSTNSNA